MILQRSLTREDAKKLEQLKENLDGKTVSKDLSTNIKKNVKITQIQNCCQIRF